MFWTRAVVFIIATCAFGAPAAAPKGARIAVRYGSAQVLIMGEDIDTSDVATAKILTTVYDKYPKLPRTNEIPFVSAVPARLLQSFKLKPRTDWRIGTQWQLYPGAGPSVTVAIEAVVILSSGCGGFRDGAIARFLTPAIANRVAGGRANEFLVAPGVGLANVSQTPLIPTILLPPMPLGHDQPDEAAAIRKVLFSRALEIVKDENWEATPNDSAENQQRVREWNRSFLSATEDNIRIGVQRWEAPGRKPLLFVTALWVSENAGKETVVFAAEAILEEGNSLEMLSFEYGEAERMRISEFIAGWSWTLDSMNGFLNAYKIGNRYFVLRRQVGYESGGVALQEIHPNEGIVETNLWFAFGC